MLEIIILYVAPLAALVAALAAGIAIVNKANRNNLRLSAGLEDGDFINIALCETIHGIKTHYHEIGVESLNFGGYAQKGHPTLCGSMAGWDMRNQDVEATCADCREALAKMAGELSDEACCPKE